MERLCLAEHNRSTAPQTPVGSVKIGSLDQFDVGANIHSRQLTLTVNSDVQIDVKTRVSKKVRVSQYDNISLTN